MTKFILDIEALPTHTEMTIGHWTADERTQFCKALEGIKAANWFVAATVGLTDDAAERIAKGFAYAAFGECRRRLRLADDDSLMQDSVGMGRS